MGFFSDIVESVKDFIDPILPESVKDNPIQSILSIGAAPFTGGASLMALTPQLAESGLGQLGVDIPSWITPMLSSLMLAGTPGFTLPGFGEGGMLSNLTLPGFGQGGMFSNPAANYPGGYAPSGFADPTGGGSIFGNLFGGSTLPQALKGMAFGGTGTTGEGIGILGNLFGGGGQGGLSNILGSIMGGGGGGGYGAGGGGYGSAGGYSPYTVPPPGQYQTAQELMDESLRYVSEKWPEAYGARESALRDIGDPRFYESFQPTSFEEALGAQQFANIWPDVERGIKHDLSLSGMAYSPQLAAQTAKARGNLGVDIGSILADLGQRRADASLQSRLAIDPLTGLISPYAGLARQQGNLQTGMDFETALAQAQQDALASQEASAQKSAKTGLLSNLIGGGLGFLGGRDLSSALQLSGLAGTMSPLWGGNAPYQYGDYQGYANQQQQNKLLQDYLKQSQPQAQAVNPGGGAVQVGPRLNNNQALLDILKQYPIA